MARVPTSGATFVTPYRTEAELGKVLKELCPEAEFSASEIGELYLRLGAIIGQWSAEQSRLNALSVARALTRSAKMWPRQPAPYLPTKLASMTSEILWPFRS